MVVPARPPLERPLSFAYSKSKHCSNHCTQQASHAAAQSNASQEPSQYQSSTLLSRWPETTIAVTVGRWTAQKPRTRRRWYPHTTIRDSGSVSDGKGG
jgi:hypothetical protein